MNSANHEHLSDNFIPRFLKQDEVAESSHDGNFGSAMREAWIWRTKKPVPFGACEGQFAYYTWARKLAAQHYLLEVLPGMRRPEQIEKIRQLLDGVRDAFTEGAETMPLDLSTSYKEELYGKP